MDLDKTVFARAQRLGGGALLVGVVAACTTLGEPAAVEQDWQTTVAADHPLVGHVWDAEAQAFAGPRELGRAVAAADFVLLGEKHDNPDHHDLQAWLVAESTADGRRRSVVFEMISTDEAAALEAYLAAHGGDAAGLGPAVRWQARGWPDWAIYRPVAEAAFAAGLPLAAGDIGRAERKALFEGGAEALAPAQRGRLALDEPLPSLLQAALAEDLREAHCGHLPEAMIDPMSLVQRGRDGALAANLMEYRTSAGAILIAGAGHVRKDRAVPRLLTARMPARSQVVVAMREVSAGIDDPRDYVPLGPDGTPVYDFVVSTPRVDDADPCAAFTRTSGKG